MLLVPEVLPLGLTLPDKVHKHTASGLKQPCFYFLRIIHVDDFFITDASWHHICIARSSSSGQWNLFQDGVIEVSQTGLATNFSTGLGYLVIGAFQGSLAHFNMWDEFISHSRITDLACSSFAQGNVVAWPEVQFWRVGHVTTKNISAWKMSGENLTLGGQRMLSLQKLLKSATAICRGERDSFSKTVMHSGPAPLQNLYFHWTLTTCTSIIF